MILESLVASLITAKCRKGKFENLARIKIKGWYLFILAALIKFAALYLEANPVQGITPIVNKHFMYIYSLSYILIFAGLLLNFGMNSIKFILIGAFLNFLVITANGGQMPVSIEALKIAGLSDQFHITHTAVTEYTKLEILADIIPIPKLYPLAKVLSIGDLLIVLGVFLFIQEMMVIRKKPSL